MQLRTVSLVPQQIETVVANVEEKCQQVRQAEGQLESANLNLGYTELRAPADGWITKRNVQYAPSCRGGHVDLHARHDAPVGDRQLQGIAARPHAFRRQG